MGQSYIYGTSGSNLETFIYLFILSILMVSSLFNKDGSIKIPGSSVKLKEKTKHEERGKGASTEEESKLATVNEDCSKCGHGKAFWWEEQTRASDEPETSFFRCVSCKHTWREYS